ncbi:hypothetical protein PQX77_003478 [Marasmius sp. AFHP31]|nr:hypothetical protein PQX77_003478 [Marasmius sp. AFHP31]
MHFLRTSIALSASIVLASAARLQYQSQNTAFSNAGTQGCIAASSKSAGASVVIHGCNTGDASNYIWEYDTSIRVPDNRQIKLSGTDLCVDVKDGINADGTKLQLWTCTEGNSNQDWAQRGGNLWQWVGTTKCIDLTNGVTSDGNPIQVWNCDDGNLNNQGWRLQGV